MAESSNIREFKLKLAELGRKLPADLVRTHQRLAGLAMFGQVITSTPVLTGRLRGAWQTTVGQPATSPNGRVDKSGDQAKAEASAVLGKLPDFAAVWFTNPMPYAEIVDQGGYRPPNPEDSEEANKARAARRTELQREKATAVADDPGAPLVAGGFSLQAPQGISTLAIEVGLESLRRS